MKKFIAFEGLDGCGKTTQIRLFASSLKKVKKAYFLTREPGGTKVAEKVREILVKKSCENFSSITELLLIYAARHEHLKEKVIPNLKKKIVLCDRFFYSTYCYQILANDISMSYLNFLHKNFAFNLLPDINILLLIDPNISIKRSLKIKNIENRFEKKSRAFHNKVSKGFESISKKKNVFKFDGNTEVNLLHRNIIDLINKKKIFDFLLPYAV